MKKVNMRCRRARMPSLCMKRTSTPCEGGLPKGPRMTRWFGFRLHHGQPSDTHASGGYLHGFFSGRHFACGYGFHEALIHKADGSGLLARLVGLSERIESVCFSPDGKKLGITGGQPGRMGRCRFGISGPEARIVQGGHLRYAIRGSYSGR